jgi:hypothetical protein
MDPTSPADRARHVRDVLLLRAAPEPGPALEKRGEGRGMAD